MHTFPEKMMVYHGCAMYLDMGFETLRLKCCELKLRELTVRPTEHARRLVSGCAEARRASCTATVWGCAGLAFGLPAAVLFSFGCGKMGLAVVPCFYGFDWIIFLY